MPFDRDSSKEIECLQISLRVADFLQPDKQVPLLVVLELAYAVVRSRDDGFSSDQEKRSD